jgi:hypothetical protein
VNPTESQVIEYTDILARNVHYIPRNVKCRQGMLKLYLDMLNVTHNMVTLCTCMVNVSRDMIQVFTDMERRAY